jgi:hypothetical protein
MTELWEAADKTGTICYDCRMAELLGERIAKAIIDAEMAFSGYVRLDRQTEARLAVYLNDAEQARILADAGADNLMDAFIELMPAEYDIRACDEGLKATPFPAVMWLF